MCAVALRCLCTCVYTSSCSVGCLRAVLTGRTTACIRSGTVGQVSYRDSGVPCRRRHSYSGISTLRFPLIFVDAQCLILVLSSVLRVIVVFGIFFVVRVRCYRYRFLLFAFVVSFSVRVVWLFRFVVRWFVFFVSLSVSSPFLAFVVSSSFPLLGSFVFGCAVSSFVRYRACFGVSSLSFGRCPLPLRFRISLVRVRASRSFVRVSLPLRYRSFRLSSLRVVVYVWNVPLSLYRFVVVLHRSFGLCSSLVPRYSTRLFRVFRYSFSYRRLVGNLLSCTVRMNVS